MTTPDKPDKNSIFAFLMKGVCALIMIPAGMYIVFRGAFHYCLNNQIYSIILMILNAWTLIGILICTFLLAPEHQTNHKRLWLVFFVPTIGWYLCAPLFFTINVAVARAFSSVYTPLEDGSVVLTNPPENTNSDHQKINSKLGPAIFYARYPLSAGTKFTIANVKVLSAEVKEAEDSILANSETYFGEDGSPSSILSHKAKHAIAAGAPIKNSDVEPAYSDEFILNETK